MMSYKKGRTIGSSLVQSDIGGKKDIQLLLQSKKHGTFPCLSCNCCTNCLKGPHVYHPRKGTPININGYYTCLTMFAVYVIKCPCGFLYVGQTTRQVRDRIREHKSAIKTKNVDQAVAGHFVVMGHGIHQLKFQVVDHIPPL
ncbi:hypothetical protein XELAEV_18020064mg [Xenopus laevis]|uniref:GIY-YIG domain-containing protein n=1 Tax=Xenopus laevis TaxID=8355 RepID=A0A974D900_XENLA|nr:hypothetical protein XELAEV_18020064mg [Xenopus laevis]